MNLKLKEALTRREFYQLETFYEGLLKQKCSGYFAKLKNKWLKTTYTKLGKSDIGSIEVILIDVGDSLPQKLKEKLLLIYKCSLYYH